jgi:hypothetical protein
MLFEFDFQLEIMHDFLMLFTVKNVSDIPVPRESLVSDIPAGDGNVANLFYGVVYSGQDRLSSYYFFMFVTTLCTDYRRSRFLSQRLVDVLNSFVCVRPVLFKQCIVADMIQGVEFSEISNLDISGKSMQADSKSIYISLPFLYKDLFFALNATLAHFK